MSDRSAHDDRVDALDRVLASEQQDWEAAGHDAAREPKTLTAIRAFRNSLRMLRFLRDYEASPVSPLLRAKWAAERCRAAQLQACFRTRPRGDALRLRERRTTAEALLREVMELQRA
jgi:hypothetical protein